jgi:hypothetical protein
VARECGGDLINGAPNQQELVQFHLWALELHIFEVPRQQLARGLGRQLQRLHASLHLGKVVELRAAALEQAEAVQAALNAQRFVQQMHEVAVFELEVGGQEGRIL